METMTGYPPGYHGGNRIELSEASIKELSKMTRNIKGDGSCRWCRKIKKPKKMRIVYVNKEAKVMLLCNKCYCLYTKLPERIRCIIMQSLMPEAFRFERPPAPKPQEMM